MLIQNGNLLCDHGVFRAMSLTARGSIIAAIDTNATTASLYPYNALNLLRTVTA